MLFINSTFKMFTILPEYISIFVIYILCTLPTGVPHTLIKCTLPTGASYIVYINKMYYKLLYFEFVI